MSRQAIICVDDERVVLISRCSLKYQGQVSDSRQSKGEKAIWPRRFWEHLIRYEQNFINHVDYIHYNPYREF